MKDRERSEKWKVERYATHRRHIHNHKLKTTQMSSHKHKYTNEKIRLLRHDYNNYNRIKKEKKTERILTNTNLKYESIIKAEKQGMLKDVDK